MNYEYVVTIHAPREHVWNVLTDVARWPEWTASMSTVTVLGGTALGRGSKVRIKQPKMPALVWEVTEFEPRQAFSWKVQSPGVSTLAVHRIGSGPGADVTVQLDIQQTGILDRLVGLFTAGMTRRYVQLEAAGLKRRCEETAAMAATGS
jgi:uncharacterized protein YndB with AHSA1/START domain